MVGLPHSSPLMKLPMRPKNSPSGGSGAVKSKTSAALRPRRQANSDSAATTPSSPPWKDMPPSQIFSGYHRSVAQNFSP